MPLLLPLLLGVTRNGTIHGSWSPPKVLERCPTPSDGTTRRVLPASAVLPPRPWRSASRRRASRRGSPPLFPPEPNRLSSPRAILRVVAVSVRPEPRFPRLLRCELTETVDVERVIAAGTLVPRRTENVPPPRTTIQQQFFWSSSTVAGTRPPAGERHAAPRGCFRCLVHVLLLLIAESPSRSRGWRGPWVGPPFHSINLMLDPR